MKVVKYKDQIVNCACIRTVTIVADKEVRIQVGENGTSSDYFYIRCDNKETARNLVATIFDEMKGE